MDVKKKKKKNQLLVDLNTNLCICEVQIYISEVD